MCCYAGDERIDTSSIGLPQHTGIFGTELLRVTLRAIKVRPEERFMVAGDFNSSETFDNPKPRDNRTILDPLNAPGFTEVIRECRGALTSTFRTPRGGYITHQRDHMYVTSTLLGELESCDVASAERVFGPRPMLSDHLPLLAEFSITQ